ncbi:uncharacterized protein [Drosophila tropicalis]|uniref:uncharacterized protein n=1 Tax=Drosophila tropicalis TaxID=46794 RepID=UPI0035AC291C
MMKAAKLKKIEDQVRIGGKGTPRRKHKHVQRTSGFDEKRLQNTLQKLSLTPINDIQDVTFALNDGREMIINSPKVQGSVVCNMFTFSGEMFEVLMKIPNNETITFRDELKRNFKQTKQQQEKERQRQQQQRVDSNDDDDEKDDESEGNPPKVVSVGRKLETIREEEWPSNDELLVKASSKNTKIKSKKAPKCLIKDVQQQEQQQQKQEDITKDKKKKKQKKPRIRIRSRNKTVVDGSLLDGSGDGPNVAAKCLNQNQSNVDATDCISLCDSDKTSIFSDGSDMDQTIIGDNDSFITLFPNEEGDDEIVSNADKQINGKPTSLDAEEVKNGTD